MAFSRCFFRAVIFNFRVRHLDPAIEKTGFTENEILLACCHNFFYPVYSLEPNQFYYPCVILKLRNQSSPPLFTLNFQAGNDTGHLGIFCCITQVTDLINFGFINMPEREILQQVFKCKNTEFLSQQVAFNCCDTGQVFYRAG